MSKRMPPGPSKTPIVLSDTASPQASGAQSHMLIGGTFVVVDATMGRPTTLQVAEMTAILSQRRREQRQQQYNENAARARQLASEVEHAMFEAYPMEF